MSEARTWRGSCHCGRIAFEVNGALDGVVECNCSICRRKGVKMWFVPHAQLRLLTPEGQMGSYSFGNHPVQIRHRFCPHCGIHVFGEFNQDNIPMAAINVRCLEEADLDALPVQHFDGKNA